MTRRGLTLIEVVAAAALLAVIAAACLPLMDEAARWADSTRRSDPIEPLMRLADAVLLEPGLYGLDPDEMTAPGFEASVGDETRDPAFEAVSVRLLTAETAGHGWLVFEAGGVSVCRFIDLPDPDPETETQETTPAPTTGTALPSSERRAP